MAADHPPAMTPFVPEEERIQEASLQTALARLQEMHIALRHLRDTIPRIVSSIQTAEFTQDPAELYAHFSMTAAGAGRDIKGFMQLMDREQTKAVFEQVKKSREADGEGIAGWRVTEHEDWLEVKKEAEDEDIDDAEQPKEQAEGHQQEDRERIVHNFKLTNPSLEVLLGDIITVKLPPPANICFSIAYENLSSRQEHNGTLYAEQGRGFAWKIFSVTDSSMRETKFTKSLLNATLSSESNLKDLGSILEMVSSYLDIETRPCTKCSRSLDRIGQLPVVRSRERMKQADGQYITRWLAFHRACT